ncbi:coiled-coil-helix-coiled-coil-helix domain-containing protein 5-like, partial [Malurus melanocephalus]|uniref:coiled-coil-helix-coiled-coil-helix domain-containing protein 5-like n=1 Tax=Malurus melanocephalus TaxID=175006 RepID=UPI002547B1D9
HRPLCFRCASNHPLVRQIRRDCSDSFGAFERCLREHPGAVGECGPHVSAFLLCAENVTPNVTPDVTSGATPRDSPGDTSGGEFGTGILG